MRIGIDISCLAHRKTGVGIYTEHLVKSLLQNRSTADYLLFSSTSFETEFEDAKRIASLFPRRYSTIWEQLILPILLLRGRIDVFHSPNYTLPLAAPTNSVVTVHDMSVVLMGRTHPPLRRIKHRLFLLPSLRKSKMLITVSESSKKDIERLAHINPERIRVVYPGVSTFFSPLPRNGFRAGMTLPDSFVLYVGTIEPRKNLTNLIKAYALVHREIGRHLVIAGARGWLYDDTFALVEKLGLGDRVVFVGYVTDENLRQLYNLADLFVYPSLYEGFGFPPLEAMACGCPVITSNVSSLPEVAGQAALQVDPRNVEALAEGISRVLSDRDLYEEMVGRGLVQAARFTWDECARQTLGVYEEVCGGKSGRLVQ